MGDIGAHTVLCTGEGETAGLASLQTGLSGHARGIELTLLVAESSSKAGVVGPAAKMIVIGNCDILNGLEGGILVDGEVAVVSTAGLGLVTVAWERALRLLSVGTLDGLAAVAVSIVDQTGVPITVALALSNALLDSHVITLGGAAVGQDPTAAGLGETSRVNEGLEGVQARREGDLGGLDEGDRCHGSSGHIPNGGHVEGGRNRNE